VPRAQLLNLSFGASFFERDSKNTPTMVRAQRPPEGADVGNEDGPGRLRRRLIGRVTD
jgi:hypothetical protein